MFKVFHISSFQDLIMLMIIFVFFLWLIFLVCHFNCTAPCSDGKFYADGVSSPSPRQESEARGVGYSPSVEPFSILAGLAFFAFLLQTFHAMYLNQGLLSNLLSTLGVPTRNRLLDVRHETNDEILRAINFHDYMRKRKKRKTNKSKPKPENSDDNDDTLVRISRS